MHSVHQQAARARRRTKRAPADGDGQSDTNGITVTETVTTVVSGSVLTFPTLSVVTPTGTRASLTETSTSSTTTTAASSSTSASTSASFSPVASSATPTISASATLSSSSVDATSTSGSNDDDSITVSGASSKSGGVPPAAIGVVVAVLVIGLIALTIFFVRKRYIHRRQNRRKTWSGGIYPFPQDITAPGEKGGAGTGVNTTSDVEQTAERSTLVLNSPVPSTYAAANSVLPPQSSYNNPSAPKPTPSLTVPVATATAAQVSNNAVVRCTFIPSLPDELSISTGETVRIMAEYDDGWALCVNGRGDHGMVPLECLDRSGASPALISPSPSAVADWRLSKRASSLRGGRD